MHETPAKTTPAPRTGNLIVAPSAPHDSDSPARAHRPKLAAHKPAGWTAYITLVLLTVICYAPIFKSDLVWPEYDKVERSPFKSLQSWTQAWSPEMIRQEDPITLTSYFLEQKLPLPPAISHHALNLLLHVFAAVLLLKTLDALELPAAFSASLVFALHPSVLQTLFWSGYRSELVGLILLLSALYLGVHNRSARSFLTMMIVSVIAYILHPATLVLPLLLGLCIFYQNPSFHIKDYNRVLPLLCLALFVGVWTHSNQPEQATVLAERFSFYANNLFFCIKQSLLPFDLALFHPFNASKAYSVGAQNSFLPFLLFIPFYILIAIYYKQTWARGVLIGLSAYLLLIIYAITQTGSFIDGSLAHEDHLQYMALPFLMALIVCTAGSIARNMGSGGRILWCLGFTLFMLVQITITATHAYTVSDRTQMWYNLSQQWPDAWLPKLALIETLQESEEESEIVSDNEIIKMLESILEKQPDRIQERQLLARIYREDGQKTNALRQYRRILRESTPSNELLEEAAAFYDELGLSWDAQNARERITSETP